MKPADIREFPLDELNARLDETKEELFNLRFQHATGQLENYGRLGEVRRDVARLLSVRRERELGIAAEPAPEEVSRRREAAREEAGEDEGPRRRRGLRRRGAAGEETADDESSTRATADDEMDDEGEDEQ